MINTPWVSAPLHPNQVNLEHEYAFDGAADFVQDTAYPDNWGAVDNRPQQLPPHFQPTQNQTHNPYLNTGDRPDFPPRLLQPRFGFPPQNPNMNDAITRSSSNESYLQHPPADQALRYGSSSELSSPTYPGSGQYSSHGASPAGLALNLFPPDAPNQTSVNESNRFVPADPSHLFQSQQPQHFQRSTGQSQQQPPLIYSDDGAHLPPDTSSNSIRSKRQRTQDDASSGHDAAVDDRVEPTKEEAHKAKPGACARCKNLKVRCEFRSESETCRRCINGGHECVIPGRKKRRVPPKREHLLNQIREQAAEIQRLMEQLQIANQKASVGSPPSEGASTSDLSSTQLEQDVGGIVRNQVEVCDWVARARESIEAFGGYIGIGTASGARNLIEESDSDQSDSELSDLGDGDEFYGNHGDGASFRYTSPDDSGRKKEAASDKLATIPSQMTPFGLMANMSLRKTRMTRGVSLEAEGKDEVGVARDDYFRATTPDPTQRVMDTEQYQHPHILTRGVVTPDEAENLFHIYFENMNPSLSLLDPILYTAHNTYYRSPFLFTVICAIASRYYSKPSLYQEAMRCARLAAGTALISGQKTIETVQAYILLSLYPTPVKRWEDNRSWLYLGLAIRVAIDLNLHIRSSAKPQNEIHARELLNRTRVWLNCYNVDRSTGSQYGKAPTIPNDDYIGNHSGDWWKNSEYNLRNFDIHLCAYNAELSLIGRFRSKIYSDPNHPTGLNKEIDFERVASETDDELVAFQHHWLTVLEQNTDPGDRHGQFRTGLIKLAYSYARMVALSFGFQRMSGKNQLDDNPFITRCCRAAMEVCLVVINELYVPERRIFLRHGPEAHSVFVTFAAAFLIRLLHPKYATCINAEQRQSIHDLVQQIIDVLGSSEIAVDDHHGPMLYSRLLGGLLAAAKLDSTFARKSQRPKAISQSPHRYSDNSSPSRARPPLVLKSSKSLSPSTVPSVIPGSYDHSHRLEEHHPSTTFLDNQSTFDFNVPEFFIPPLPFDTEMLQSVQSLTTSNDWNGMVLPGLNFMGQLQDHDAAMKDGFSGSRMYYHGQQFMQ